MTRTSPFPFRSLRPLGLLAALLGLLAACGGGGGSPFAPPNTTTSGGGGGDYNAVVITPSVTGTLVTGVGGTRTVTITFTSSDTKSLSALTVTGGLDKLPAGWSGPATFGCSTVTSGNGCVLSLVYRPTAPGSGALTLPLQYQTNGGSTTSTGFTVLYLAEPANHVAPAVSPVGPLDTLVGATQPVIINFTSDDGKPVTGFAVTTDLTALPAGWSSTVSSLACASVTSGNGCQLSLAYSPTGRSGGVLSLTYRYTGNTGIETTGSVPLTYLATSNETVGATVSPAGQIAAVINGGAQTVHVTFATVGGSTATQLTLPSGLAHLPADWSTATPSFACATVGTGNGCDLVLTYTPKAAANGLLLVPYRYVDNAGTTKFGTASIPYAATGHNNVVGTASSPGTIVGIENGSQTLALTFTTDDTMPATQFSVTSDLTALPAGWSSSKTSLTCATVSVGSGCQLPLTFAPTAVVAGSVAITYHYTDHAGTAKTGTASLPYRTVTNNSVVATAAPAGQVTVAPNGAPQAVTLTFTTNDGLPASGLSVTTDLTSLPGHWSAASPSFACAQVSTGSGCQLTLTYSPTAADRGVLSLAYAYANNAGAAQTATVTIPYETSVQHLYVVEPATGIYVCALGAAGAVSGCTLTGSGYTEAVGLAIQGTTAYVADFLGSAVWTCTVNGDGTLSACADSGIPAFSPQDLTIAGGRLYVTSGQPGQASSECVINGDGSLGACTNLSAAGVTALWDMAFNSTYAYLTNASGIRVCPVAADGTFSSCSATGAGLGFNAPYGAVVTSGTLYVANQNAGNVLSCVPQPDGSLTACQTSVVGAGPSSLVVTSTQAYVADAAGKLHLCGLQATGPLAGTLVGCAETAGGQGRHPISTILLN